jgi:hypothetical protein
MKTLKIGVVLLALFLATMVIVPMVNAQEQATTGANVQLPNLQVDNSQPNLVIQNGFSLSKGYNLTEIPEGSIIQHSTGGITRVFDSNGKQISISNDADSPKIPTPHGYIEADKILGVPEGAYIQVVDNVTTNVLVNNTRVLTVLSQDNGQIPTASTSGWIESAQSANIGNIQEYIATWNVPSSPANPNTGAINYIFNGLQPSYSNGIVQPVLEYNVYTTNHAWTARPWYVDSNNHGYYPVTPINTAPGHLIEGEVSWNSNVNRWYVMIEDLSTGGSLSELSTNAPNIGTTNDFAVCALEGYYINNNNDVAGTTTFNNMQVYNTNWQPISLSWHQQIATNFGLSNLGVSWPLFGFSPVTLST